MTFLALTKRRGKECVLVDYLQIAAIEDHRSSTDNKDFAWTNVWLTNGVKFEVVESAEYITTYIWRAGQH